MRAEKACKVSSPVCFSCLERSLWHSPKPPRLAGRRVTESTMVSSKCALCEISSYRDCSWRWVNDHPVHMLSPNLYQTTSEALQSFHSFRKFDNFGFTEKEKFVAKYLGAAAMYMVSKKLKKKCNITD